VGKNSKENGVVMVVMKVSKMIKNTTIITGKTVKNLNFLA
jgi:hypothetical protein